MTAPKTIEDVNTLAQELGDDEELGVLLATFLPEGGKRDAFNIALAQFERLEDVADEHREAQLNFDYETVVWEEQRKLVLAGKTREADLESEARRLADAYWHEFQNKTGDECGVPFPTAGRWWFDGPIAVYLALINA